MIVTQDIVDFKKLTMNKQIALSLAYLNLNSIWNKFEFRKRLEPKKAYGIEQQQDDINQVKDVLNFLEKENRALTKKVVDLELRLMKAEQLINNLKTIYETN